LQTTSDLGVTQHKALTSDLGVTQHKALQPQATNTSSKCMASFKIKTVLQHLSSRLFYKDLRWIGIAYSSALYALQVLLHLGKIQLVVEWAGHNVVKEKICRLALLGMF